MGWVVAPLVALVVIYVLVVLLARLLGVKSCDEELEATPSPSRNRFGL